MVDWKALTVAGVAVAVTAAFVLVGAAVRFATRILSFSILAFLIVAVGYAVYELIAGWNEAATESDRAVDERESLGIDPASEERRDREPRATLSESEFERELEDIRDDADDGYGAETERNTETR